MTRVSLLAFLVSVVPSIAATQPAPTQPVETVEKVEWQPHWRKVQWYEYAATAVFGVTSAGISWFVESPRSGHYDGVLFDDATRNLLRAHSRAGRNAAATISDWGYRSMLAFPYLDVALTWAIHGNSEVAWQMLSIDLESLSFAGVLGLITNHFTRRARPSVEPCAIDPAYEAYCYRGSYSSFMSGHAVTAAAGAGVTCAHHLSMPLYGGGAADIAICAATSAIALTTGITRIVNDRHWATDVVTAWLVGAAAGYVWPRLFHYRTREEPAAVSYIVFPSFSPDGYSASVIGLF